ncbi:MAG: response regulator [Campylobacterota bacterium]|nr:response regulator [Campylobacterota bacterium]
MMKRTYQILCVDDNKNNLFTLKVLLQQLGSVEILTVLSGREALNVLLKQEIDLVILDIQMPEMDGFEVARLIKLNQETRHIPVLFLTAVYKSEEFIAHGYELGAVDYLTKPIDDHLLLNKINLYLSIFHQRDKMVREQNRFQHLAESIAEGIYVLDADHRVIYVNPKALDLLGYSENELMGQKIHEMIHYHDLNGKKVSAKACPVHRALHSRHSYLSDNELFIRKNGSSFPVSIAAAAIQESAEEYSVVVIFRDMTQIKEQQRQTEALLEIEKQRIKEQEAMIESLVRMIDQRDSYTAGHTQRVAHYCVLIAREMGYPQEEIELLEKAAKLHDIGKVATPDSILLKPGKLNLLEYSLIKEHLNAGHTILKDIPNYHEIAEIMRYHHERFDGKGYPSGRSGYDIPPLSRIMIVADAFDAMTTNRIYKPRMDLNEAIVELNALKNMQFHPEVVDAAVNILSTISIQTDITQEPHTVLEEERFAYFFKDRLTGHYFSDYLPLLLRERFSGVKKYFLLLCLQNFSEFNRLKGWHEGDKFLQKIANYLSEKSNPDSVLFRIQGDDFLVVSATSMSIEEDALRKKFLNKRGVVRCELSTFESDKDGEALQHELNSFITG